MKVEIEIPEGYKAEWVNGVLTLVRDKKEDTRPVTERIKTFEDACNELGPSHPFVLQYKFNYNEEDGWNDNADTRDFSAYLKLRIITAALNEGWTPQFTLDENRYYPWHNLYTKDEWCILSENAKREHFVLFNSNANNNANDVNTVFVRVDSDNLPSTTFACVGSRLCYKSRELALYSSKQFASLWLDFCYLPNTECKPYINE